MAKNVPRELTGCQIATTRVVPRGRDDDSSVRLAGALGLNLFPWQESILAESARTNKGQWSSFENVVIAPRQQGKSTMIVARALAGVLVFDERLVIYSAHEYRTAQETWLLMTDLCRSDFLAPYVRKIRTSFGGETIEFHNGARFKMMSRTKSSGRGFSPDCLLLDEAFALTSESMASLVFSMSARPNPQLYYLSSAGTWQSEVLLALRRRGHSGTATRLGYWEWHAHPDDDIRSEKVWRCANPSYGVLLRRSQVESELETMSTRTFQRERLGIWSESFSETALDESDVTDALIDPPVAPRDGRAIGWGVDTTTDRSHGVIAAAFVGDDGKPVVTVVEARPGAGWIPHRAGELQATYGGEGFAYDAKGGIVDLMERAERDHDVIGVPLKYSDYPAACAGFVQAVADHQVKIGRVPALVTDAVNGTARMVTNGWVWDRKVVTPPTHLIAATCAYRALDHGSGASGVAVY